MNLFMGFCHLVSTRISPCKPWFSFCLLAGDFFSPLSNLLKKIGNTCECSKMYVLQIPSFSPRANQVTNLLWIFKNAQVFVNTCWFTGIFIHKWLSVSFCRYLRESYSPCPFFFFFSCTSLITSFVLGSWKYHLFFSAHVFKDSTKILLLWQSLPQFKMLFVPSSVCLQPALGPSLMIVESYSTSHSSTGLAQDIWTG